jgi:hypothetical protein
VSDLYMAVLGHPQTGELMLLEWDEERQGYSEGHVLLCQMKGYVHAGTFAVVGNGTAGVICSPGPDAYRLMCAAVPAFAAYVAAKKQNAGDSAAWLDRLHALPDLREN